MYHGGQRLRVEIGESLFGLNIRLAMQDAGSDDDKVNGAVCSAGFRRGLDGGLVVEVDGVTVELRIGGFHGRTRQRANTRNTRVIEQGFDEGAADTAIGAGDNHVRSVLE